MSRSEHHSDATAVDLPCRLFVGGKEFKARLADLSFDRARLSAPNLPEFMADGELRIEAEGLGPIDTRFRWRNGELVGVELAQDPATRHTLKVFFAAKAA